MKISINNFKSIKSLQNFDLKPLTILSGVNSTGKSSFIQLLLILKQTIDFASEKSQLSLDGDLYKVREYLDILNGKKLENRLKIGFEFNKAEDIKVNSPDRVSIYDIYDTYQIRVEIEFDFDSSTEYISEFKILYKLPRGKDQLVTFNTNRLNKEYKISASSSLFVENIWAMKPEISEIKYTSIYPATYELVSEDKKKDFVPKIKGIRELLDSVFSSMSYIGPLREQPRDEYSLLTTKGSVGKNGEFTAQILENHASDPLFFLKPVHNDGLISYDKVKGNLLEAVKFWMCEEFKIGKDIYSKKIRDAYSIFLINESGIETTIKHVGFGISQVLPIVVEGLRLPVGGTLILEQPEIHLHPKVQSMLFDFLYSLILEGKKILIETHSDHFITRMRRRIAEDQNSEIQNNINLTFIESDEGNVMFGSIDLDDFGTMNYFPTDFIEQTGLEMRAILKAQMVKRAKKSIE